MRISSLSYLSLMITFSLLLGLIATTSAVAVEDFSGTWQGQWLSYHGGSGGLSVQIIQKGNTVSGKITIRNTPCGTFADVPLTGNVSGNVIAVYGIAHCPLDGSDNSLQLTQGSLKDNKVIGLYAVYSDGDYYDSGDFYLTRSVNYIYASAGQGGSITPAGKISVKAGTDITFKMSPNDGYKVLDVIVDGTSVGAKNSYTFNKVSANHKIKATFETAPASTGSIVPTIIVPLLLDDDNKNN